MLNANLPEPELLKVLLKPLLDDFDYWFSRSHKRLLQEDFAFLAPGQQKEMLTRVTAAWQEVQAAQSLFQVTNGEVGIDPVVLMGWHRLVMECWQLLGQRRHQSNDQMPTNDQMPK